jgi:hypothetical protein
MINATIEMIKIKITYLAKSHDEFMCPLKPSKTYPAMVQIKNKRPPSIRFARSTREPVRPRFEFG